MSQAESLPLARTVETESELREGITRILRVLRDADGGDLSVRVEQRYHHRDPIAAIALAANATIEMLGRLREDTQMYQRDLEAQIGTIEKQREAIRELSTPIIEVWAGVLCIPIVGVLDSSRASEMTSALLDAVVQKKAPFIIIDITGIEMMDTRATDHFLRMARSVRLLGAECVLSGVNPSVARTDRPHGHRSRCNTNAPHASRCPPASRKRMRQKAGAKGGRRQP